MPDPILFRIANLVLRICLKGVNLANDTQHELIITSAEQLFLLEECELEEYGLTTAIENAEPEDEERFAADLTEEDLKNLYAHVSRVHAEDRSKKATKLTEALMARIEAIVPVE